eukprot:TRINITY_DN2319_c0_g1_i2.p1 TRINITY_DN2319_c0_g1~~TRINITY_DN2319_c0_g1_i2.p1  ORF type:complete len:765 (+),score=165.37 TRINITY_DN2319_c0_g1_i2:43-2337(+)
MLVTDPVEKYPPAGGWPAGGRAELRAQGTWIPVEVLRSGPGRCVRVRVEGSCVEVVATRDRLRPCLVGRWRVSGESGPCVHHAKNSAPSVVAVPIESWCADAFERGQLAFIVRPGHRVLLSRRMDRVILRSGVVRVEALQKGAYHPVFTGCFTNGGRTLDGSWCGQFAPGSGRVRLDLCTDAAPTHRTEVKEAKFRAAVGRVAAAAAVLAAAATGEGTAVAGGGQRGPKPAKRRRKGPADVDAAPAVTPLVAAASLAVLAAAASVAAPRTSVHARAAEAAADQSTAPTKKRGRPPGSKKRVGESCQRAAKRRRGGPPSPESDRRAGLRRSLLVEEALADMADDLQPDIGLFLHAPSQRKPASAPTDQVGEQPTDQVGEQPPPAAATGTGPESGSTPAAPAGARPVAEGPAAEAPAAGAAPSAAVDTPCAGEADAPTVAEAQAAGEGTGPAGAAAVRAHPAAAEKDGASGAVAEHLPSAEHLPPEPAQELTPCDASDSETEQPAGEDLTSAATDGASAPATATDGAGLVSPVAAIDAAGLASAAAPAATVPLTAPAAVTDAARPLPLTPVPAAATNAVRPPAPDAADRSTTEAVFQRVTAAQKEASSGLQVALLEAASDSESDGPAALTPPPPETPLDDGPSTIAPLCSAQRRLNRTRVVAPPALPPPGDARWRREAIAETLRCAIVHAAGMVVPGGESKQAERDGMAALRAAVASEQPESDEVWLAAVTALFSLQLSTIKELTQCPEVQISEDALWRVYDAATS